MVPAVRSLRRLLTGSALLDTSRPETSQHYLPIPGQ